MKAYQILKYTHKNFPFIEIADTFFDKEKAKKESKKLAKKLAKETNSKIQNTTDGYIIYVPYLVIFTIHEIEIK